MKRIFAALAVLISISATQFMANAADSPDKNYFNVRNFGAVGDGTNLDSPAINKAIDACA